MFQPLFLSASLLAALTPGLVAQEAAQDVAGAPIVEGVEAVQVTGEPTEVIRWDRRAAEHLLNRAGFGARPDEIEAAVALGLPAVIDSLFPPAELQVAPIEAERLTGKDGNVAPEALALRLAGGKDDAPQDMVDAAQSAGRKQRRADRDQLEDYTLWWFDTLLSGQDPLRDRMTLFWHGYFTSSMDDVKSSYQMIEQNQLLRGEALGSFRELLHAVAKNPAMLEYLDNDENRKGKPNENFAREVMELFTLGEGNYSEDDIKEAARAFTGWRMRKGDFAYVRRQHDRGDKTVLGVTGQLTGEDVLDILLDQEVCADYVAGRIVEHLEGRAPSPERMTHYGALLRDHDYQLEPLLRALLADPDFYRDEVVGTRVAGPVDYLVGVARRIDVVPPRTWMLSGSRLLGQRLFHPPNVKGWEGGMAWMTTASLMQRGNLAGILVGSVDAADVLSDEEVLYAEDMQSMEDGALQGDSMGAESDAAMDGEALRSDKGSMSRRRGIRYGDLAGLKAMQGRWNPSFSLAAELRRAGARTDEAVVDRLLDQLLAVEAPADTRAFLIAEYGQRRVAAEAPSSGQRMRERRRYEQRLRDFAHLILSLPEAQLH